MQDDPLDQNLDQAVKFMKDAERRLESCREWLPDSVHRRLLDSLVAYVLARVR